MGSELAGGGLVAAFVLATMTALVHWALGRAAVIVDEMVKQDYPSFGARLGDVVLWIGARRTPEPVATFDEWHSHMAALRAASGRPCLPDALWMFVTSLVKPYVAVDEVPAAAGGPMAPDPSFSAGVMDQIFRLWVEPELARRGRPVDRSLVRSAVVVMAPRSSPQVLLDDEAQWVARMPAKRAIKEGEEVGDADVDLDAIVSLRPRGIDADAGWTGFVRSGGRQWISFDLRRNRGRARRLLDEAATALAAARRARRFRSRRRTLGHLLVAANLAVDAQEILIDDDPPDDPVQRAARFRAFAELGNAPMSHSRCLDRLQHLSSLHGAVARWLASGKTELEHLTAKVEEMIELAALRAGD